MTKQQNKGFTLVELSIVIIIIGFLIAGVAGGTSLIKQAALNSVITDLGNFQLAFNAFKNQYGALPGDMPNAYNYWGSSCGDNTSGTATSCNGNGDGFIGGDGLFNSEPTEDLMAWKQLQLAGLISGSYTGTFTTIATSSRDNPGENIPSSKLLGGNSGYLVETNSNSGIPSFDGNQIYNRTFSGNYIQLGGGPAPAWGVYIDSVMTAADALNIDTKFDDGNPVTGNLIILRGHEFNGTSGKCMTGYTHTGNAESIILSDESVSCSILYIGPELQAD